MINHDFDQGHSLRKFVSSVELDASSTETVQRPATLRDWMKDTKLLSRC